MSVSIASAALNIDAAKQDGLVGERPDGLIGAVSGSAEVDALVNSVNAQRMAKYNQIAQKNGTPVAQVQAVAGQSLIAKTPPGQYIMNSAGGWQKK
jgi:uncharacterized protein YdbL (DUF1318 family)